MNESQINDSIVIYKDNNSSGARTIWIKFLMTGFIWRNRTIVLN